MRSLVLLKSIRPALEVVSAPSKLNRTALSLTDVKEHFWGVASGMAKSLVLESEYFKERYLKLAIRKLLFQIFDSY